MIAASSLAVMAFVQSRRDEADRRHRVGRWPLWLLSAAVIPIGATVIDARLILSTWAACDVGINASANALTYGLIGPVTALTTGAWFTASVVALGRRRAPVGLALGMLGVVALLYTNMAIIATPADYPAPFCPRNVPPWWPEWLPV